RPCVARGGGGHGRKGGISADVGQAGHHRPGGAVPALDERAEFRGGAVEGLADGPRVARGGGGDGLKVAESAYVRGGYHPPGGAVPALGEALVTVSTDCPGVG